MNLFHSAGVDAEVRKWRLRREGFLGVRIDAGGVLDLVADWIRHLVATHRIRLLLRAAVSWDQRGFSFIGADPRNLKPHACSALRCTIVPMEFGPSLGRNFFERPCLEVAHDLIGLILVRRASRGGILTGRIVEVEAYLGEGRDPASHAHRGPTPRNQSMFGPAGRLYVYRSYGIHLCANLVCEAKGSGAAVLLRAVEPLTGMRQMRRNRGLADDCPLKLIAAGPGRLTQAFDIRHEHDGSVLGGEIALRHPADRRDVPGVVSFPRVGISKAVERPYRFCAQDSAYLSKPPAARRSRVRRLGGVIGQGD